jgi:KDO2-lipid IV(A) lauroyltransferase
MKLAYRLEAWLLRRVLGLFRALGPVRASNFAGGVARMFGPLLPVTRVAEANLLMALPELDAAARRLVIRGMYENLGRTMGELPHLASLRRTASGPGWEIEGENIVRAVADKGGPAIFVSAHFGNWEMLPPAAASLGAHMSSMYRAANNPLVNEMINALRQEAIGKETKLFPKGSAGARGALAHLARGGYLGILMDQKMNDGIAVEFFGRPAMTAPALAALALRFRCPVIPGYVRRIGPARLRVTCEPALALPDTGDRQKDQALLTRAVNERFEAWIRATPECWFWLHRRWPKQ